MDTGKFPHIPELCNHTPKVKVQQLGVWLLLQNNRLPKQAILTHSVHTYHQWREGGREGGREGEAGKREKDTYSSASIVLYSAT